MLVNIPRVSGTKRRAMRKPVTTVRKLTRTLVRVVIWNIRAIPDSIGLGVHLLCTFWSKFPEYDNESEMPDLLYSIQSDNFSYH